MMIAHNVYFRLQDNAAAAVAAMISDCHAYLAGLPGIVFYAAGVSADADRAAADIDYDVALNIVFEDRAAMDAYMAAPKHIEFMEKHEGNWKDILVFDSSVDGAPAK
jgi:hypothetical protein